VKRSPRKAVASRNTSTTLKPIEGCDAGVTGVRAPLALPTRIPGYGASPSCRVRRHDGACGRYGGRAGSTAAFSRCRPH
jgi:hypothetical protein